MSIEKRMNGITDSAIDRLASKLRQEGKVVIDASVTGTKNLQEMNKELDNFANNKKNLNGKLLSLGINIKDTKNVEKTFELVQKLEEVTQGNKKQNGQQLDYYSDSLEEAAKKITSAWDKIKSNVPSINENSTGLSQEIKDVFSLGSAYEALGGKIGEVNPELSAFFNELKNVKVLKGGTFNTENLKSTFDVINQFKISQNSVKSLDELLSVAEKLMAVNGRNVNFRFLPDESKAFLKAAKEYKSALEETGSEADETGEKILKLFNSLSKSSEGSEYLDSLSTPIENISEASKQAMENLEKLRLEYEKLKSDDKSKYDSISSVADGESKKAEIIQTKNALKGLQRSTLSLDLDSSTTEPLAKEIKELIAEYGHINAQIDAQIKGIQASNKDAVKQLESSLKSMSQQKLFTDEITNWKNDFADYIRQVKNGVSTYEEVMAKINKEYVKQPISDAQTKQNEREAESAREAAKQKKKEQSKPATPSPTAENQSQQEEEQAKKAEKAEKDKKKTQSESPKVSDDAINQNEEEAESAEKVTKAEEERQKAKKESAKVNDNSEVEQLESLRKKVNEVTDAVDEKTKAFTQERLGVETNVDLERAELQKLIDKIKEIEKKITELTEKQFILDIDLPENFDTIVQPIKELMSSTGENGISELTTIKDFINGLNINKTVPDNMQKLANAIMTLKSNLNNLGDGGSKFLSDITALTSKSAELGNLATILKSTKEKIKEAASAVNGDKTLFSREEFNNQYDSLKQTGEKYLSDNNFLQVLESSIKRSEKGIATFTAKVKDSNDAWHKFSATIDKDGNVMASSIEAMSAKQGAALDKVVEEMGMLNSSQIAEVKDRVEQAITGIINDAKVTVDKNGGINIFRTVTDSDGIVQNLANHFDDIKDIIDDTGNVASNFVDQLDDSPIILNETTKELSENVALWDSMIDLARQYKDVIGSVQNVTQMVRTDNGEKKRSYRITGDTGNSLTVGANGEFLNSTIKIDDSLTQSEESYKRQTAALQELSKLKLSNYKATLSGNDAEIAKTEILIQHQKELIQNEKDFRSNTDLNNNTGDSKYAKQVKMLASNLKAQKEAALASQVSSDWDEAIKENKKRQLDNEKAMKTAREEAIRTNKEIADASEESYKRQETAMNNLTNAEIKNHKATIENDKEKIASTQAVIDQNQKLINQEINLRNEEFTTSNGTKIGNLNTTTGDKKISSLQTSLDTKKTTSNSGIDQAHEEKETIRLIKEEKDAYKELQKAKLEVANTNKNDNSTEMQKTAAEENVNKQKEIYEELKKQVDAHQQIVDKLNLQKSREADISQIQQTYANRINKISGNKIDETPNNLIQAYKQLIDTEEKFQLLQKKNDDGLISEKESKALEELTIAREAQKNYINEANKAKKDGIDLTKEEIDAEEAYIKKQKEAIKYVEDSYSNLNTTKNSLAILNSDPNVQKMNQYLQTVKDMKVGVQGIEPIVKQTETALKNLNTQYVNGSKSEVEYQKGAKKLIDDLNNIKMIVDTTDHSKIQSSVDNTINSMGKIIDPGSLEKTKSGWEQTAKYIDLTDNKIKECTVSINSASGAMTIMTTRGTEQVSRWNKVLDFWKEKLKNVVGYLSSFVGIFEVWNAFKQGVTVVSEFNTALIEMQKVSDEGIKSLKNYQNESFSLAREVGTTALQIQQSTADFMRLGQNLDEAKESAKNANILMNVSEFTSIDEATESLIAITQAYKELEQTSIIDRLNAIGNNYSISTDELAVGLQKSGATLSLMGNSIDEAAALITVANSTIQDVDSVAAGIKTISLRIAGTEEAKQELSDLGEEIDDYVVQTSAKKQQIIKDYTATASNPGGIDILNDNGNLRNTYDILLDISKVYKEILEDDKKFGTNRGQALVEELANIARMYGDMH